MGFSQWEHSVIPAGLCRRVNTFFSQARNSLAGAGVRRGGGEGGGGGQRGERRPNLRIPVFIQTVKTGDESQKIM